MRRRSSARNAAPMAPSTTRWSHDSVIARRLPGDDRAVGDDGDVAHLTDGEDGALGRIDDRRELVDAEHAQVRDRERPVGHLLGLELPGSRPCRELPHLARDRGDALLVRVADDRRDEPVGDGDRDGDVDAPVDEDGVGREARVALGHAHERDRAGLDEQVVDRHLRRVASRRPRRRPSRHELGVDLLAERHELGDVDVDREIEVRDGRLGLGEPPRDRPAHRRRAARLGRRERRARLVGAAGATHERLRSACAVIASRSAGTTPAARPAPVRALEIDALLARDLAHVRRREDASAVRVAVAAAAGCSDPGERRALEGVHHGWLALGDRSGGLGRGRRRGGLRGAARSALRGRSSCAGARGRSQSAAGAAAPPPVLRARRRLRRARRRSRPAARASPPSRARRGS